MRPEEDLKELVLHALKRNMCLYASIAKTFLPARSLCRLGARQDTRCRALVAEWIPLRCQSQDVIASDDSTTEFVARVEVCWKWLSNAVLSVVGFVGNLDNWVAAAHNAHCLGTVLRHATCTVNISSRRAIE